MSNFTDTILNIEVFAFIALLAWLYLAPIGVDAPRGSGDDAPGG
ncbi:hypothetical protein [Hongsoonwoonella zoysiae]|nr:hypothetical protein [Hongsoonwoonella zoysiae]